MRTDPPACTLRLCSQLPVRTHEARPYVGPRPPAGKRKYTKRILLPGSGRGGKNKKPIAIDGKTYVGVFEAKRAFRIGSVTLARWLVEGRAVWA